MAVHASGQQQHWARAKAMHYEIELLKGRKVLQGYQKGPLPTSLGTQCQMQDLQRCKALKRGEVMLWD